MSGVVECGIYVYTVYLWLPILTHNFSGGFRTNAVCLLHISDRQRAQQHISCLKADTAVLAACLTSEQCQNSVGSVYAYDYLFISMSDSFLTHLICK